MFSWVAIERAAEEMRAQDPKFHKKTEGKPFRSAARHLSDLELVDKLRSFGLDMDRASMSRLIQDALSAEQIASRLMEQCDSKIIDTIESDWIWICVEALWRRWFPHEPSFEKLDDRMQEGYKRHMESDAVGACRLWLDAWDDVVHLLDKGRIQSIGEFDELFGGTQHLFNWIQDLEIELWNAGVEDRQFLEARVAFCEEGLRRFDDDDDDDLLTRNRRRALAESYSELGQADKADALFREWLRADPQWGGGWLGWADCYFFTRTERKNLKRSEELLLEGFSVPGVRDRFEIGNRLADIYEEQERHEEAEAIKRLAGPRSSTVQCSAESHNDDLPRTLAHGTKQKMGRNSPCSCGSGKKFKKCCGRAKQLS